MDLETDGGCTSQHSFVPGYGIAFVTAMAFVYYLPMWVPFGPGVAHVSEIVYTFQWQDGERMLGMS